MSEQSGAFGDWIREFEPKLRHYTRRWEGFSFIAKRLLNLDAPDIVEVGCIRTADGWGSDGQSTRIWEWIAKKTNGRVLSIDLDPTHLELASKECPTIRTRLGGGIQHLATMAVGDISFLYLDGMDFLGGDLPQRAWLQHIGFLAACWERLPPGCLIAIDDCMDDHNGKHVYVKKFFEDMNINPSVAEYIHAWIKP